MQPIIIMVNMVKIKQYSFPEPVILELRGVTYHMGSHIYLPPNTSEHTPPNPSQTGLYSITDPGRMELG